MIEESSDPGSEPSTGEEGTIYPFAAVDIDGQSLDMHRYRGKVILVVNVASRCGFTPQYEGLQGLYEKYKDQGLVILGFPCNQFGMQEPGANTEIRDFCSLKYGVTFPMFSKVTVNGAETHPIYAFLKHQAPGLLGTEAIKWNFTKFLVDRNGKVVGRYAPNVAPSSLAVTIEGLL
jgi:glutathione peroxidase